MWGYSITSGGRLLGLTALVIEARGVESSFIAVARLIPSLSGPTSVKSTWKFLQCVKTLVSSDLFYGLFVNFHGVAGGGFWQLVDWSMTPTGQTLQIASDKPKPPVFPTPTIVSQNLSQAINGTCYSPCSKPKSNIWLSSGIPWLPASPFTVRAKIVIREGMVTVVSNHSVKQVAPSMHL